jgi:hypothetical protein
VAFLRGDHLLGFEYGVTYAFIAVGLLWFLARALVLPERPSLVGAAAVVVFALPVGFVMAFPASVNPDVQRFINKQADDRAARQELAAVFASDTAFRDLSVSTTHLKIVNVTVRGPLPGRPDLDRLRARIAGECRVLKRCPLHWDVTLRDSGQRVEGLDSDLFKAPTRQ